MGPPSDKTAAGLGECDTPLEPYVRWLREYAIKNSEKSIFWPPEGREVELSRAKNLQLAISQPFFAQIGSKFLWGLLGPILCLMQKKIEIREILLLRLEFTMF